MKLDKTSSSFVGSFQKLLKTYKSKSQQQQFIQFISDKLKELLKNPYPPDSRQESLPSKVILPDKWTFHKLAFKYDKGASGQIRIMYLVNEKDLIIKPIWIYTHEQFSKRPPDKDIKNVVNESLENED